MVKNVQSINSKEVKVHEVLKQATTTERILQYIDKKTNYYNKNNNNEKKNKSSKTC